MYIWVGLNVDRHFSEVKERAKNIDTELNYVNSCFTLPMHISLKMSFEIKEEMFEQVVDALCEYYRSLTAFELTVKGIENEGNIVWIRYKENYTLSKMKDSVNAMLKERFGIGLHEYDSDYLFHTTLFMENDEEKNAKAYEQIKDSRLPQTITVDRFAVGFSPNGKLGTYKIFKEIAK